MMVGVAAMALNGGVAIYGAIQWRRGAVGRSFWWLVRAAQATVVLEIALGGVLLATGRRPPGLHVLYGVLPLLVSLIAESLRAASAQMVLDQRGLESAQAVGKLPAAEQEAVVVAIIRRELGVMALAALVVVVLLVRAAQTHG